jgi:hypothetical protein
VQEDHIGLKDRKNLVYVVQIAFPFSC